MQLDSSRANTAADTGFVPTAFIGEGDEANKCDNFAANAEFPEFCERCGWYEHEHSHRARQYSHIPALLPLRKAS